MKNLVEPDIVSLARFGRERDIEIRYIEFMPLDAQGIWERDRVLTMDTMIGMLQREIGPLEEIPDADPRAPATEYRFKDGIGRVGFIASVSKPFCLNCNRIRLTSDGKLRYCLFAMDETDVKALLRSNAPDAAIVAAVRSCVAESGSGTRSTRRSSCRRRGRCIPSAGNASSPRRACGAWRSARRSDCASGVLQVSEIRSVHAVDPQLGQLFRSEIVSQPPGLLNEGRLDTVIPELVDLLHL